MFSSMIASSQVLRIVTDSANLANQIPGYSQIQTITTKTIQYNTPIIAEDPLPIEQ